MHDPLKIGDDNPWKNVKETKPGESTSSIDSSETSETSASSSTSVTTRSSSVVSRRRGGTRVRHKTSGSIRKDRDTIVFKRVEVEDVHPKKPSKQVTTGAIENTSPDSVLAHPTRDVDAQPSAEPTTIKRSSSIFRRIMRIYDTSSVTTKALFSLLTMLYLVAFLLPYCLPQLGTWFSPLCVVPGVSYSPLCASHFSRHARQSVGRKPQWADFKRLAQVEGDTFDKLFNQRASGSALALHLKNAQMATSDVAIAISHTSIPRRNSIVASLHAFKDHAKETAKGLQRFNARMIGSMDLIISANDYALYSLHEAQVDASKWPLLPWRYFSSSREETIEYFTSALFVAKEQISVLERMALDLLGELETLDYRLEAIKDVTEHEIRSMELKRDGLDHFWTRLGFNKKQVKSLERNQKTLQKLNSHRGAARTHVTTALMALQETSKDLEELRERVADTALAEKDIPIHVHIDAIQAGIKRLRDSEERSRTRRDEKVEQIVYGDDD